MSSESEFSGVDLAGRATSALERGEHRRAAELADEAARAFLSEQGEPSFDAPNMLRVAAEALLAVGAHGAAVVTVERAGQLAAALPAGELFDRLKVKLASLQGKALLDGGDRTGARAVLLEALELCERTLGRDDVDAGSLHNLLGVTAKFFGDFDEAQSRYERALEIFGGVPGGEGVAATLEHNLGGLAHSRGDLASAEQHTRRALALSEQVAGATSTRAAADRGQLGAILSERGKHAEAERELRQTIRDFAAAFGEDHFEVGIAYTALGAALHRAGRLQEAEQAYRHGLAVREHARGADHPELAPTLLNISRLLEDRGNRAGARDLAARAVSVLAGQVQADHPHLRTARERLSALNEDRR